MSSFESFQNFLKASINVLGNNENALKYAQEQWEKSLAVEEARKKREHELALATLQSSQVALSNQLTLLPNHYFKSPSKLNSALSNHSTNPSAVKEERKVDSKLREFLAELVDGTPITFAVNGMQIAMGKEDQSQWFEAIIRKTMTKIEVRGLIKIEDTFDISIEDMEFYSLIHDPRKLHDLGETDYQKWFNEQNVGKRSTYLLDTHSTNSKIPVAKQHEDGLFKFSGKTDNLSILRPLAIEFKGERFKADHQPSSSLSERHFEVLEQSIRRVYSISCVQQYFANIGVFAVCFDRVWLVWYDRKLLSSELKQQETIHIMNIDPEDFGYLWALLTKQALKNRNVMFGDNDDYYYIINFLNSIYPRMSHYCRTRFINMSMNRVYAISLPQLLSATAKTICVSKLFKHFALKVVTSKSQFEQEVKCIATINKYISEKGVFEDEFPHFYAFGSKRWNDNCEIYNNSAVDFTVIYAQMKNVFRDSLESSMSDLKINGSSEPWWLFEPRPPMPLEGGVIAMLCGDFYHEVSPDTLKFMAYGVQYWLNLYHNARVVHRDIRLSNIMRFDYPPIYQPYANRKSTNETNESYLQWQLIDFNLGYCLNENEHCVLTKLTRDTAQWKNAGWAIQKKYPNEDSNITTEEIEVPWSYCDDDQMFINVLFRIQGK